MRLQAQGARLRFSVNAAWLSFSLVLAGNPDDSIALLDHSGFPHKSGINKSLLAGLRLLRFLSRRQLFYILGIFLFSLLDFF